MVMGMFAMSASAEDEGDSSTAVDSNGMALNPIQTIDTSKTVQINKNSLIPDGSDFTITMVPATADEVTDSSGNALTINDQEVYAGVAFSTEEKDGKTVDYGSITYSFGSTDSTAGEEGDTSTTVDVVKNDQSFNLTKIPFTHTGIYRYYVTETTGSEPYITYDTTKYEVDLYVIQYTTTETQEVADDENPGSTKEVEVTTTSYGVGAYRVKKMVKQDDKYVPTTEKPESCSFTNVIKVTPVTISKTVEGETYTTDEAFDFYIRIPAGGEALDLQANTTISAEIHHADGSVTSNDITVLADLTDSDDPTDALDLTPDEFKAVSQKFTLKAGESLVITGAPQGMIYFLMEENYTDEGYTQSYIYKETNAVNGSTTSGQVNDVNNARHSATTEDADGNVISKVFQGTVGGGDSGVQFINTRNIKIDTGVVIEYIPYALMMIVALCGAVLFISKKRRIAR
jgi:hypothetical protein